MRRGHCARNVLMFVALDKCLVEACGRRCARQSEQTAARCLQRALRRWFEQDWRLCAYVYIMFHERFRTNRTTITLA